MAEVSERELERLQGVREAARHVLRYGKLGKQSKRRLRTALYGERHTKWLEEYDRQHG